MPSLRAEEGLGWLEEQNKQKYRVWTRSAASGLDVYAAAKVFRSKPNTDSFMCI